MRNLKGRKSSRINEKKLKTDSFYSQNSNNITQIIYTATKDVSKK